MQHLEVSGAVRLIYRSLGVKGLNAHTIVSERRFEIFCRELRLLNN